MMQIGMKGAMWWLSMEEHWINTMYTFALWNIESIGICLGWWAERECLLLRSEEGKVCRVWNLGYLSEEQSSDTLRELRRDVGVYCMCNLLCHACLPSPAWQELWHKEPEPCWNEWWRAVKSHQPVWVGFFLRNWRALNHGTWKSYSDLLTCTFSWQSANIISWE